MTFPDAAGHGRLILANKSERGSGTLATVGLTAAIFGVALLGVGAVDVFVRVTDAIRFAEQVSVTVAERLATGSTSPCVGLPEGATGCFLDAENLTATVTVSRLGVVAGSTAGGNR